MHPRSYFLSGTNSTTSQANQCISRHGWAPTSRSTSAVQWNCAGFQATQHMVANGTCTLLSHTVVFDTIDTHVLCPLIDVLFSHVSLCAVFSHICAVLSHTLLNTNRSRPFFGLPTGLNPAFSIISLSTAIFTWSGSLYMLLSSTAIADAAALQHQTH